MQSVKEVQSWDFEHQSRLENLQQYLQLRVILHIARSVRDRGRAIVSGRLSAVKLESKGRDGQKDRYYRVRCGKQPRCKKQPVDIRTHQK